MFRALRNFATLLCVACLAPALAAQDADADAGKRIAITFDDTPRHPGVLFTEDERAIRIIAALGEAGVQQAAFFLNPGKIEERNGAQARIEAYVAAGHVIANHTATHPKLSDSDAQKFIDDIHAAHEWIVGRKGYRPWFRFPYLDHGGGDKAKRDAVRSALAKLGLRNGYVTVDASDWFYDQVLSDAVREGKAFNQLALNQLFVESHLEAAEKYDEVARAALGRSPAHVLLLHESDLVALNLTDLIAAFRKSGWRIITADEAYEDPLGESLPDVDFAQGTLTEMIAWERGVPAPRWYARNDTRIAQQELDRRVFAPVAAQISAIPEAYRGVWFGTDSVCEDYAEMRIEVSAEMIRFYESEGTVSGITRTRDDKHRISLDINGEGETWSTVSDWWLEREGTILLREDQGTSYGPILYHRCKE